MSRIVEVIHPAFCHHVPMRAATPRQNMIRMATPVQLVTHPRDAFDLAFERPRGSAGTGTPIMAGPGGLWEFVEALGDNPVTEDELVLYLTGELGAGPLREMLESRFDRTPVAAHGDGHHARGALAFRGNPVDLDRSRNVHFDGRPQAAADLSSFFAGEVAIVGGKLAMRARPLAHVVVADRFPPRIHLGMSPHGLGRFACTPESFPIVARMNHGLEMPHGDLIGRWTQAMGGEDPLDDVRWAVNNFAGPVRKMLDRCVEAGGYTLHWAEVMRGLSASFRPIEIRSLTGQAGTGDLAHEVRLLRKGVDRLCTNTSRVIRDEHAGVLRRVLDEAVLPRTDAIDHDDVEALGSLAPG